MILKAHDLLQIDADYLRQLGERDPAALAELSVKLAGDLKEAWERMNQNSSNSSRPSGCEAPWSASASETDCDSGETDEETPANTGDSDSSGLDESGAAGTDSETDKQPPSFSEQSVSRPPGRQKGAQGFDVPSVWLSPIHKNMPVSIVLVVAMHWIPKSKRPIPAVIQLT